MALTVREILAARRQRLIQKRQQAVALAQALQAEIDALNDELSSITPAEEARFARLQTLVGLRAED